MVQPVRVHEAHSRGYVGAAIKSLVWTHLKHEITSSIQEEEVQSSASAANIPYEESTSLEEEKQQTG